MILVMCANAGIDRTYEVENFQTGKYHNPRRFRADAGGKGVNVARSLNVLGDEVLLTGFAGGASEQLMTEKLSAQGIITEFVHIGEESRLCINIVDPLAKNQTQLDETSPLVTPEEVARLKRNWARQITQVKLAIISGSAPRGVPFHFYEELVQIARKRKVPVIVDAHDQLLRNALNAAPEVIKPNIAEFESIVGEQLSIPEGIVKAGKKMVASGIRVCAVSLGNQGAIYITPRHGIWWATAPKIDFISSVGAGDAMVAGFAHASVNHMPMQDRMRFAVAAGAAVTSTFGAALESRETVAKLTEAVELKPIEPPVPPSHQ